MSFHVNSSQQYSLTDITNSLTECEKKALENSWAKIFAEEIEQNTYKVAALNVRKLFTFRNGLGNYAQNPILIQ